MEGGLITRSLQAIAHYVHYAIKLALLVVKVKQILCSGWPHNLSRPGLLALILRKKKNEWSGLACFMVGVPRVTFTMFVRSVIFGNYL